MNAEQKPYFRAACEARPARGASTRSCAVAANPDMVRRKRRINKSWRLTLLLSVVDIGKDSLFEATVRQVLTVKKRRSNFHSGDCYGGITSVRTLAQTACVN